ncbi:MAG: cobyrinate a,c-diamide synthase [Lachnospiraceae bacterium]|nr:cobyrinate a,c-diamide synthase [Lachnospiraceae bacterium]
MDKSEEKEMGKIQGKKTGRILIAGSSSGAGKTLFACALMTLLRGHGCEVQGYKCGPDFIDPMFHSEIAGVPCENLDPFFMTKTQMQNTLKKARGKICVLEGAMGVYDGIAGAKGIRNGSCYQVACDTQTPILLLVDAKGMGQTVLSILRGILLDDVEGRIAGIVFNRMSKSFFETIRPSAQELLEQMHSSARIFGFVPHCREIHLESRYLGLLLPTEIDNLREQAEAFARQIEEGVDLELLERIWEESGDLGLSEQLLEEGADLGQKERIPEDGVELEQSRGNGERPAQTKAPLLAVARDEAFCFYYHQNIKCLEAAGANITFFSPLHDKELPKGVSGLLLGGGYPELFAKQLSDNQTMRESIRKAIESGMPSLAECGGFLYLHEWIEGASGERFPMVGVVDGGCKNAGHLVRFGYVRICGAGGGAEHLLSGISEIRGHEFHYFDSENNGTDCVAEKPFVPSSWRCMHAGKGHLWGFAHLYYPSAPGLAGAFVARMREYHPVRAYQFFENKDCEYYPCHKVIDSLNCLFCYCPFYWREDCPGHPVFKQRGEKRIKNCSYCTYPHQVEHYDEIRRRLAEMVS